MTGWLRAAIIPLGGIAVKRSLSPIRSPVSGSKKRSDRWCHGDVDHGIRRCLGVDGEAPDERSPACGPEPVEVGQGCSVDVVRDLAHLGADDRRSVHFEMYDDFRAEKFAEADLPLQATIVRDVACDRGVLEMLGADSDDDVPARERLEPCRKLPFPVVDGQALTVTERDGEPSSARLERPLEEVHARGCR